MNGRSSPCSTSISTFLQEFFVPNLVHGIKAADIDRNIQLLIRNLVEIKDTSGEFLLRLADGRVIDTKGWNDWEWTHGVGLYGIWKYYQQTQRRALPRNHAQTGSATGSPRARRPRTSTPSRRSSRSPIYTRRTRIQRWLPYLDEWAEWLMDGLPRTEERGFQHIVFNSENREQLWDDTLMMSVLPLAKIGKLLGRPHYVEEARRQFMLHIKYLVDRKTRPVVPRLDLRWPPQFRQCAVGARQLLGDDRDSGVHRAARPSAAATACASSCSRPTCSRSARW